MSNAIRVNEPGFANILTPVVGTNAICLKYTFDWKSSGDTMVMEVTLRDNDLEHLYTENWYIEGATLDPYLTAAPQGANFREAMEATVRDIMTDVFAGTITVPGHDD